MDITLARGDITRQKADAIVNAANSSLMGGGGVDGAIHRNGGPEILEECRRLRASRYGRGLPTGQAVATTAGRLPARWVIHTVGPVYSVTEDRSGLLASCYRESLRVAESLGAATVAFPAIGTGIYGWPLTDGARVAIEAVRAWSAMSSAGQTGPAAPTAPAVPDARTAPTGQAVPDARTAPSRSAAAVVEVRFVLFDASAYAAFEAVL